MKVEACIKDHNKDHNIIIFKDVKDMKFDPQGSQYVLTKQSVRGVVMIPRESVQWIGAIEEDVVDIEDFENKE